MPREQAFFPSLAIRAYGLQRRSILRNDRGFTSPGQAQRFLSVHGQVHNLFRVGRHLLRAENYRILRGRAFAIWQEVTCAQ